MQKIYLILVFVLALTTQVFAQRTLTGTVTDEAGATMPGVAIRLLNTTLGTVTDLDGKYSLRILEGNNEVLFTYTGYKSKRITLAESNVVDLQMELDELLIDEVRVTALGVSRKEKSLGYAVQNLEGDGFVKARETNLVNALNGKIAGVQINNSSGAVGSSSRITLRGVSSLTGENSPLFVVDGIPIDNGNRGTATNTGGFDLPNGVADINPDDIASISVLKGPNAAALYGVRASAGVIVITTKKGTAGGNKGLGISFNSSTTFETPLVLPDFQNSYGQGGNSDFFEWINGSTDDGGVDESWGPPLDAGLEFTQWNSYTVGGKPLPWKSVPNNIRDFYETGVTTNNNISFTGGNNTVGYRLSLGAMKQKGMVPNTDYARYNISGGTDFNITSRLKAGLSINYSKAKSDNLPIGGYDSQNPVQQMIWSGRNVDFNLLKDYKNLPLAPAGTAAAGTPINWNTVFQNNPFWVLDNNLNKLNKDRIIGNVNASYNLGKGFTLTAKTGMDLWNSLVTEQKAQGTNGDYTNGYYKETARSYSEMNSDVLLSYQTRLTDDLELSLSAGANRMDRKERNLIGEAPQLELKGIYNLANVKSGTNVNLTNEITNSRINSIYGFGQFAFKNAVYLDFTGRNDWASVLPKANNSFFYPSVTLSAVVTDLFDIHSKALSFLKLRAGWAKVGSIGALQPYKLQQVFKYETDKFGTTSLVYNPSQLNNANLKAEATIGKELGIDTRLFNGRAHLDLTFYDQNSTDLILPVEVSTASGYITVWQNIGQMQNRGTEVQLGVTPIKTKDLTFEITLNWAKNNNTVKSLGGLDALNLGGQWNVNLQARENQPYGVLFGPAYERANNQIVHQNGLPKIATDLKVLGDIQPDWTGGITFDLKYKFISLNTVIDGKKGGAVYSMTNTWGRYSGVLAETLLGRETGIVGDGVMDIGTKEKPNYVKNDVVVASESYNKAAYSNNVAEGSVFDASFIKLRQVMVGFELPNKWFDKNVFKGASISLVGRNLAILHRNAPHIDPETGFSSKNGEQGQEFGQLPSARSLGFNLNFNF